MKKTISHKEFKAQMMKKAAFRNAYEDLALEFRLIKAIINQRAKKGMTQEKLARKLGTKQSAIARFEAGRSNPTLAFVKKLSRALDLELVIRPSK